MLDVTNTSNYDYESDGDDTELQTEAKSEKLPLPKLQPKVISKQLRYSYEFHISTKEWEWAKQQQQLLLKRGEKDFKVSRKMSSPDQEIDHSFLCIQHKYDNPLLLCFANQSQYLQQKIQGQNNSKVKLAKAENGQMFVVKIIENPRNQGSKLKLLEEEEETLIEKELNMYYGGLERVSHTKEEDEIDKHYQVKEYLGQDLPFFLATHQLTQLQRYDLAISMLEAVKKIHDHNILHRDLHEKNICVKFDNKGNLVASIIDFGKSKKLSQNQTQAGWEKHVRFYWRIMAPELGYLDKNSVLHKGKKPYFNRETEIYALGLIMKNVLKINDPKILMMCSSTPEERPKLDDLILYLKGEKSKATLALDKTEDCQSSEEKLQESLVQYPNKTKYEAKTCKSKRDVSSSKSRSNAKL